MVAELPGGIDNAFCGQDDIQDEARRKYDANSLPDQGTMNRTAQKIASSMVLKLSASGYSITPSNASSESQEIQDGLRSVNSLLAAARLIAATPERARAENTPEPGQLKEEAQETWDALFKFLEASASTSAGLRSHWHDGDTVPYDDPKAGLAEDEIPNDYVNSKTRF